MIIDAELSDRLGVKWLFVLSGVLYNDMSPIRTEFQIAMMVQGQNETQHYRSQCFINCFIPPLPNMFDNLEYLRYGVPTGLKVYVLPRVLCEIPSRWDSADSNILVSCYAL